MSKIEAMHATANPSSNIKPKDLPSSDQKQKIENSQIEASYIEEIVDLNEIKPKIAARQVENQSSFTTGDLHANMYKFAHVLAAQSLIKFKDAKDFSALKYFYTTTDLKPFLKIDSIQVTEQAKKAIVRPIGDDFADRSGRDAFGLRLYEHFLKEGMRLRSNISNHTFIMMRFMEQAFWMLQKHKGHDNEAYREFLEISHKTELGILSSQNPSLEYIASLYQLRKHIQTKGVEAFNKAIQRYETIKNIFCLIDYELTEDGELMLYAHAPFGLFEIQYTAEYFGLKADILNCNGLISTLESIQTVISAHIQNNTLSMLMPAGDSYASMPEFLERTERENYIRQNRINPLVLLTWNRAITHLNLPETLSDQTRVSYSCGHHSEKNASQLFANIGHAKSLDSPLGKPKCFKHMHRYRVVHRIKQALTLTPIKNQKRKEEEQASATPIDEKKSEQKKELTLSKSIAQVKTLLTAQAIIISPQVIDNVLSKLEENRTGRSIKTPPILPPEALKQEADCEIRSLNTYWHTLTQQQIFILNTELTHQQVISGNNSLFELLPLKREPLFQPINKLPLDSEIEKVTQQIRNRYNALFPQKIQDDQKSNEAKIASNSTSESKNKEVPRSQSAIDTDNPRSTFNPEDAEFDNYGRKKLPLKPKEYKAQTDKKIELEDYNCKEVEDRTHKNKQLFEKLKSLINQHLEMVIDRSTLLRDASQTKMRQYELGHLLRRITVLHFNKIKAKNDNDTDFEDLISVEISRTMFYMSADHAYGPHNKLSRFLTLFPGASTESETVRLLRNFKQDHQLKATPTSEAINQFYPNIRPDNKHNGYCIRLHGQKIKPLTLPRAKTDKSKISSQTEVIELHGLKDILNQHPNASLKKIRLIIIQHLWFLKDQYYLTKATSTHKESFAKEWQNRVLISELIKQMEEHPLCQNDASSKAQIPFTKETFIQWAYGVILKTQSKMSLNSVLRKKLEFMSQDDLFFQILKLS